MGIISDVLVLVRSSCVCAIVRGSSHPIVWGLLLSSILPIFTTAQTMTVRPAPFETPTGVRYVPDIVFRIQGTDTIRLDLLLPAKAMRAPAIVFVGGAAGTARGEKLGAYAARLAKHGFVAAIIDYRPRAIGTRLPISAAVSDAKLAVRWLRANADSYGIDPARIGMAGAAEGGLVAALAGLPNWFGIGSNDNVRFSSDVGAVALLEPVLDLADMTLSATANSFLTDVLNTSAPGQRPAGGLEIDVPLRARISPTSYYGGGATRNVREHVPPFLFVHGTADSQFPFAHSAKLAKELRSQGVSAQLMPAKGARHGFFRERKWQTRTTDALVRFFRSTLKNTIYKAGWVDSNPTWSPRGDQIVFSSNYGGEWGVWVMKTDGSQLRRLVGGGEASWSPDGARIVFSREGRLATINGDGTAFTLLTSDTDEFVYATSWSPDGSHIAFSSWADNQLHVIRLSDGVVRRLTNTAGGNGCSSWFPDGSRLVFHSGRDGQSDLYVRSIEDSVDTRLTSTPANEFCPRVSPDGRSIVFQRRATNIHEHIDLFVMDIDGLQERNLTKHFANDRWASWSPDNAWIAFASTRGGNSDIYVVRPNGTGLRRLTRR